MGDSSPNKPSNVTLFLKKMPKRTFITREKKALPEHKPMKYMLTLLLNVMLVNVAK